MGGCLSKKSKKGKEEDDKTPYAPAAKRTPSPGEGREEVPLQRASVQGVQSTGKPSEPVTGKTSLGEKKLITGGSLNTAPSAGKTPVSIQLIILCYFNCMF